MKRSKLLFLLVGFLLSGCVESLPTPTVMDDTSTDLGEVLFPADFDFTAVHVVDVDLFFPPGHPARVSERFRLFKVDPRGEQLVADGLLSVGVFQSHLTLPTAVTSLKVEWEEGPDSIGSATLPIVDNRVQLSTAVTTSLTSGRLSPFRPLGPVFQGGVDAPQSVPADLDGYPIRSVTYSPAADAWGSIAFEDNWPSRGDYDFNDLVVSYRVVQYRNPGDGVVAMEMFFRVDAVGAEFVNGLGIALPVPPNRVHFVDGSLSNRVNDVGLEPGQSEAVTIAFDDAAELLPGVGIRNTQGEATLSGMTQRLVFHFQTPLFDRDLGSAPFDPFLIVDGDRRREVHLAGRSPTNLASGFVGTQEDRGGYRTAQGLPWAILIPDEWDWPVEKAPVNQGHLEFVDWARSGGSSLTDWYRDKGNNRNRNRLIRRR